ncbi:aminoglycoside phosphotransferase family protein [Bacillaceae bacterium SIJ1]|uniref:aminoglycoside phosphotransferase family protein n=1 Tax=Litoribacterium kuwaitense TaxID=1398745 RepID=UPI0013E9B06D|nr:aminoglycoside phosphotransferase family protein [Litoribacterium kuwaitense]NGP45143.1 aminoglycoside phosphotransferase family protein [Litoribacterium kuwaitense]
MDIVKKLIEQLQNDDITHYEKLTKGFSTSSKYILYVKEGTGKYILKVYPSKQRERRKMQFALLQQHVSNHVSCHKPIKFGFDDELQMCYILLSYVRGESGDQWLPTKHIEEQYHLGVSAGKELRKIHLVAPTPSFNWYQKRTAKYKHKVAQCNSLRLTFYKQDFIENYIEENIHLLKDSPVTFQHDDFHPQNIIVQADGTIAVIDFDSFDWGDPFEEFFKLPKYTVSVSPHFAKGQVDGYFDYKIPHSFWQKYNLFVALNQHASQLGGAHANHLTFVQERTRHIIDTHDFIHHGMPQWYKELI